MLTTAYILILEIHDEIVYSLPVVIVIGGIINYDVSGYVQTHHIYTQTRYYKLQTLLVKVLFPLSQCVEISKHDHLKRQYFVSRHVSNYVVSCELSWFHVFPHHTLT